jgi:Sec-independent protein translocase protein TatA
MLSRGILKLALVLGIIAGCLGMPMPEAGPSPAQAKQSLRKEVKELEKLLAKKKKKKKKHHKKHHHKKKHHKKKKKTGSFNAVGATRAAV